MVSRGQKKDLFRSVLKNKKISTLIKEAADSPIGSTRRKQVQKVISVLKKTINDGKGGAPISLPKQNLKLRQNTTDYNRLVVFPAAPPIRTPFGEKPQNKKDGTGGPGVYSINQSPIPFGSLFSSNVANTTPMTIGGTSTTEGSEQPKTFSPTSSPYSLLNPDNPILKMKNAAAEQTDSGEAPSSQGSSPLSLFKEKETQTPASGVPGTAATSIKGVQTDSVEEPVNKYKNIEDAVSSGMGPSLFAYNALSKGKDYLKSLPGFESLPEELLSGDPLLSGRVDELKTALNQKYGLDELLNQYTTLVQNGVGLQGRLEDYVRGKDEFLNQTNTMIDNLKEKTLTMDLSDPRNREAVDKHMNYLYELRGRQNKRYVEFLNSSIDQYNAKITATENLFNNVYSMYSSELETKSAITGEEYNLIFKSLSDLYTNVAQADSLSMEMETMENERWISYYERIKAGKEAGEIPDYSSGSFLEDRKSLADSGYIDDKGRWVVSDNALLAVSNPANLISIMMDSGYKAMTYSDEQTSPTIESITDVAANMLGYLSNLHTVGGLSAEAYAIKDQEVRQKMAQAIQKTGTLNVSLAPTIREAINYIANEDLSWWFLNKGAPTRSGFMEKFSGGELKDDVLNMLYDAYEEYGDRKSFGEDMLTKRGDGGAPGGPMSDQDLVNVITDFYVNKIVPSQMNYENSFNSGGVSFNNVGGDTNQASKIASAIKTVETGNNYYARGKSGEYGAYQFMPSTWKMWAKEFLGNENAPMTEVNQDKVAMAKINQLIKQGYDAKEIALIWNGGTPTVKKGINKYGVSYDSGAYADKVLGALNSLS